MKGWGCTETFPWIYVSSDLQFLAVLHIETYHNDPKFLDTYAWANSADPDQTAPSPRGAVWSGSTLFAIPSASFGLITLWYSHIVQILEWLQQIFWVSEYLRNLRYMLQSIMKPTWARAFIF